MTIELDQDKPYFNHPTVFKRLAHDAVNQHQIIISSMEMHQVKPALDACRRLGELANEMRCEIMGIPRQPGVYVEGLSLDRRMKVVK
jgi:hypothetical protein